MGDQDSNFSRGKRVLDDLFLVGLVVELSDICSSGRC